MLADHSFHFFFHSTILVEPQCKAIITNSGDVRIEVVSMKLWPSDTLTFFVIRLTVCFDVSLISDWRKSGEKEHWN